MSPDLAASATTRRLAAGSGSGARVVSEIWAYRELLYFLVWRDIKVRYKQTVLGVGWAIVQPIVTMVIFSVVFGKLAGMPSDGRPYPVFSLAALVPWTYFSTALTSGSQSVVANQHVIAKVYFPRLLVPLASVLGPLVDFAIAFVILIAMVIGYGIPLTVKVLWIPPLVVLAMLTAAAASVWLAALNVRYRDVRYVTPFLIQVWMFATPVPYSASLVPERWRALYGLNPMAGVVQGFRWALLDGPSPGMMTVVSAAVVLAALVGGMTYFRRIEGSFADLI